MFRLTGTKFLQAFRILKLGVNLLVFLFQILQYNSSEGMFILIIRALSDPAKIFTARLLLRSFLHYRNKLAERIFDSQLFLFCRHIIKKKFLKLWTRLGFGEQQYISYKKMSKFQFNILICLNLIESICISYKANENRYRY